MEQKKSKSPTELTTGEVRFSYANVWEARQMVNPKSGKPEGKPKFSVVLLIPKKDKTTIRNIEEAMRAAETVGRSKEWKGKNPKHIEFCLNDGDEKYDADPSKYDVYKGMMYLNAKANENRPPKILELVNGRLEAITERDQFYSGCYGKASLNFFAYEFMGKYGIGCGLRNLLKLRDGENLGGGSSDPEVDFADDIDGDDDL